MVTDYDSDPGRFAANQLATRRFNRRGDLHPDVAATLAAHGCRLVADIGGGNGALARSLAYYHIRAVVIDQAAHVEQAPRPAIRADASHLPFRGATFDAAAALWMLYHLAEPLVALREAHRLLREGGLLVACAPSRYNDPELAEVLPGWGEPRSFDAENGLDQIGAVFGQLTVERWDSPLVRIPNRSGLKLFLRGRGLSEDAASAAARRLTAPLTVTKRGMLAWARKT
jgi:SAM-dependent methyltransferase